MSRLAILGYGTEGQAAYRYFADRYDSVSIRDRDPERRVPPGISARLGEDYLADLDDFDLVVRSPGVDPRLLPADLATTSVTRHVFDNCRAPVIGVTGTSSDVVAHLIGAMLSAAGHQVWQGGNVAGPPIDLVEQATPDHYAVLALSSFQLQDVTVSPTLAVLLDIDGPDLKYHDDMDQYVAAKANIVRFQEQDDIVVFSPHHRHSRRVAEQSPGHRQPYHAPPFAHLLDGRLRIGDRTLVDLRATRFTSDMASIPAAALTAVWNIAPDPEATCRALVEFEPDIRRAKHHGRAW
ncbi:Mur ligase family protein [Catellatospora chokoriensis]|nr:Mur ligase family protein [Catellatospora chokoriensis]